MKKAYITPTTESVYLRMEQCLALRSYCVYKDKTAEQWSQHKGAWDSENWTGAEEE